MTRRNQVSLSATALLGVLALSTPATVRAQAGVGGIGQPRSQNERVVTQTPTPPPSNSDALRAAEGRLAPVPGVQAPGGAVDPNRVGGPAGPAREGQGDPATRLEPAVRVPGVAHAAAHPVGMDVAMLVEHALGMAIEGSALKSIAEQDANAESSRALLEHANRQIAESKALLTRAAADGSAVPATSPIRRFYTAANQYITTLASLGAQDPAGKSQVALVNHSVKEALDAEHIRQMGGIAPGSPALVQLMNHARDMKNEGSQSILRLAGTATLDPGLGATPTLLAQRGRDLLDAAEQLNASL